MKIAGNRIKKGDVLSHNDAIWRVVSNQAVQPGKSGAYAQVEMRNILNGSKTRERFRATEMVEKVRLEQSPFTVLYEDAEQVVIMNSETFDQVSVDKDLAGDQAVFLTDGLTIDVEFYGEIPIGITVPSTLDLAIADTEPSIKGRTVTSSYKPAVLENGLSVKVPEYVSIGDVITLDTATSEFLRRA